MSDMNAILVSYWHMVFFAGCAAVALGGISFATVWAAFAKGGSGYKALALTCTLLSLLLMCYFGATVPYYYISTGMPHGQVVTAETAQWIYWVAAAGSAIGTIAALTNFFPFKLPQKEPRQKKQEM